MSRVILQMSGRYVATPCTDSDALREDAAVLDSIVQDGLRTLAHGMAEGRDMAANPQSTAEVLFALDYLHAMAHAMRAEAEDRKQAEGGAP